MLKNMAAVGNLLLQPESRFFQNFSLLCSTRGWWIHVSVIELKGNIVTSIDPQIGTGLGENIIYDTLEAIKRYGEIDLGRFSFLGSGVYMNCDSIVTATSTPGPGKGRIEEISE